MSKLKKRKLIFTYRFLSVLDVLFSNRFELTTFNEDGTKENRTKFDKKEILNIKNK
jgi:hypothetical protein